MTNVIVDIEVYRNYFLIALLNTARDEVRFHELYPGQTLDVDSLSRTLGRYTLVTFNGNHFDVPLISAALAGADNTKLKDMSDKIIKNNVKPWRLNIPTRDWDHIDLIEVAPGIASLKIYGGRMHCEKMQDLPIDPDELISDAQRAQLREYCVNDLYTTKALFDKLAPQIQLREQMSKQYDIDLRSKSDAQIAEAVIVHEVERMGAVLSNEDPFRLAGETFKYDPPPFIRFETDALHNVLETIRAAEFVIAPGGTVQMPKEIASLKITIGKSTYRMGIGGLHSSEKSIAHMSDDNTVLIDRDVASYYPNIILNCGLQPENMGDKFTTVYRGIVERRLAAKRAKDTVTADSLKITINGSFGKFGSPYSKLYSPKLLIQTTITGQLSLLMLIELLEDYDYEVVSANTDGIVIKARRDEVQALDTFIEQWEQATQFETEATQYVATYSRDVNNYIALKEDGVKLKGVYAPGGLQKNPQTEIVIGAVVRYLRHGVGVEQTVRECDDIRKFISIRTVKGGAVKDGVYLGKAIRWYYATGVDGYIAYKINGYKVPSTDGAKPLMQLPTVQLPSDIDYDWYINECWSVLNDIGYRCDLV